MSTLILRLLLKALIASILFSLQRQVQPFPNVKNVYKASCWDCQDFCFEKPKRRLHDRKTEHFKAIMSSCHTSAMADHLTWTGYNRWDCFEMLAKGWSDTNCKIKVTTNYGIETYDQAIMLAANWALKKMLLVNLAEMLYFLILIKSRLAGGIV